MAATTNSARTEADLLAMVKQDPLRSGRMYGRLRDFEIPVWGIVQHLMAEYDLADPLTASETVIAQAAADYEIPPIAVRAALAYYKENRSFIDAKIDSNLAGTSG
jgi:uncharacterized protein (DUF433 family)